MNSFRFLAFLGLLFITNITFASDFDVLKKKAEEGDASSQYRLGLAYSIGTEVDKNPIESTRWIGLAAKNGDLGAQLTYGKNLPDHVEGLNWINKSAESGYINAQIFLGELYRTKNNEYVKIDIEQSLFWLKKAAKRTDYGSINASFRLFLMFENGDGVKKDAELASSWLKIALKNNILNAKDLYQYGINSRTFNDGFKYIRLSAEMDYPEAQNELGKIYTYDYEAFNSPEVGKIIVKRDGEKAIKWLKLAAKNGVADAYYQLGHINEFGVFKEHAKEGDWWEIQPNKHEAVKYYKWAAQSNHLDAEKRLKKQDTFESDPWDKYDRAMSRYINRYLEYTWYEGTISFSRGGDKRLYFSIKEDKNICQPNDHKNENSYSVWEINKQAISMIIFCKKSNKDFYYLSATPKTDQGDDFIVNAFLKSSGDILIKGSGYSFPISAIGFTKAWSGKSNKAL
jgi:TPR repeat protein